MHVTMRPRSIAIQDPLVLCEPDPSAIYLGGHRQCLARNIGDRERDFIVTELGIWEKTSAVGIASLPRVNHARLDVVWENFCIHL